jgi:MoaA/NifB/PqqE/SkfB family radical SAM enzyme
MSTNFYQKIKLTYQRLNYFIKVFSTRGNLIKRVTRLRKLAKQMLYLNLYPSLPVRLQIETTDTCNFKCIMCARENLDGMNTTSMSLQQFSQLIDAIDPYYVTLNGLGEPLIDKTIFQKLDYLHLKNIFTSMPSNGSLIRGEKLSLLAKSLPDSLCFSIDGATKESFENTRKTSDFEKVLENYKRYEDSYSMCVTKK